MSSFSLVNSLAFEILQAECDDSLIWNALLQQLSLVQDKHLLWEEPGIWDAPHWKILEWIGNDRAKVNLWMERARLMREIIGSLNKFVQYRKTDRYKLNKFSDEKIHDQQSIAESEWKELSDATRCVDCSVRKYHDSYALLDETKNNDKIIYKGTEWIRESFYVFRSKEGLKRRYFPKLKAFRISDHKWYLKNYYWTCCGAITQHHPPVHE